MKSNIIWALACITALFLLIPGLYAAGEVTGELKLWYPVTITFNGPQADESSGTFRNNRMDVTFTKGNKSVKVAGFFAADGDAAETSASSGNKWRVRFTPDEPGEWAYRVSFRTGTDIAASPDPNAGSPGSLDGDEGTFTVGPADPNAPGFYSKGLLQYVGEHYLQFAGSKEWFVKGGAGSPENFMAYYEFDGTIDRGGMSPDTRSSLHEWPNHVRDWKDGDPTWKDGKGKAIIGLVNYLASTGCNTVYMITNSVNGDGKDSWPWTSYDTRDQYDVSKLAQWEIVLRHMDAIGLNKDFYTWEAENTKLLNGGGVGVERKVYHREIIARFGHLLAIRWNFSEEPTASDADVGRNLEYIYSVEAHGHAVGTHSMGGDDARDRLYTSLLGKEFMHGAWAQIHTNHYSETREWVEKSRNNGVKWTVSVDESSSTNPGQSSKARDEFWNNVMAGGEGLDVYFGYGNNVGDCDDEDWRSRATTWEVVGNGVKFFQSEHVNRHLGRDGGVVIADNLGDGHILTNEKDPADAAYIIKNNGGSLNMSKAAGEYDVYWYDFQNGGDFQQTSVKKVTGGQTVTLGNPPSSGNWIVVVTKPAPVSINEKARRGNSSNIRFSALPAFKGVVRVDYDLPDAADVIMELFNTRGKRLAVLAGNRSMEAGSHTLNWKNTAFPRGRYILRMLVKNGSGEQTRYGHLILLD